MQLKLNAMQRPLAEILRPGDITDLIGQEHIRERLGAIAHARRLSSLLLYGPPGCGKSTVALLLARMSGRRYIRVSAPEMGLPQLRKALSTAEILVLDELHRFSKAQQDFFLPLLENGELVLIATTTENPSFSVTPQLLSRLQMLRLQPLGHEELKNLARRGLEKLEISLEDGALDLLASNARGDGRALLNLLEYASALPENERTCEGLTKNMPELVARHDKNGDSHYELASAMIKSIRGSDVDAALYYLGCLLEGGEDPRFVCRRLILSASEDIGLADPQALPMAVACQRAVEFVGMPEGFIPLAETVVYLAMARKSNSTYAAYLNVAREIRQNGRKPVPLHLRNAATAMQKAWGYGKDYKYPHNEPESWTEQQYLPNDLEGRRFYFPRSNGVEENVTEWWRTLHNVPLDEEKK